MSPFFINSLSLIFIFKGINLACLSFNRSNITNQFCDQLIKMLLLKSQSLSFFIKLRQGVSPKNNFLKLIKFQEIIKLKKIRYSIFYENKKQIDDLTSDFILYFCLLLKVKKISCLILELLDVSLFGLLELLAEVPLLHY